GADGGPRRRVPGGPGRRVDSPRAPRVDARQRDLRCLVLRTDRLPRATRPRRGHVALDRRAPRTPGRVHTRAPRSAGDVRHLLVFRVRTMGGAVSARLSLLMIDPKRTGLVLALVVVWAATRALAQSCAMCGSSFGVDDPVQRAFSWSILFLMAARYTLYGALRYGDPTWPRPSSILGIQLTALMTFLLICSSVTMVEALAAIRQGDQRGLRKFLMLTVLGGVMFLGLQAFEWNKLIFHEGQSIARNNFGATFFILTGFHGCHVFSGVVYLSTVLARAAAGPSSG